MKMLRPLWAGPTLLKSIRPDTRVALCAFVFLLLLMVLCYPFTDDGVHYQPWSSDRLMQTVALEDLRLEPLQSLEWNHIQPPMLDALRALIVSLVPHLDEHAALQFVDRGLLFLWAMLYAVLGGLVFRWGDEIGGSWLGYGCAAAVLLHPATIFYATMVDSTLLTAVLTFAMIRMLWTARDGRMASIVKLAIVYLLLFYTRSLFQWPFPLVLAFSLSLMRVPRRMVLTFIVIVAIGSGVHVAKQIDHFGTLFTSSLSGFNLVRSVGIDNTSDYLQLLDYRSDIAAEDADLPLVLSHPSVRAGIPNYNHHLYFAENERLIIAYRNHLLLTSKSELLQGYLFNLWLYVQPSSRYTRHAIVDHLPWRKVADRLTSFPLILIPTLLALTAWIGMVRRRSQKQAALAMAAPIVCIIFLSVFCERGENMRYKFFLEPTWIVFLVVWGWTWVRQTAVFKSRWSRVAWVQSRHMDSSE